MRSPTCRETEVRLATMEECGFGIVMWRIDDRIELSTQRQFLSGGHSLYLRTACRGLAFDRDC